jgi:hypothetical protein
VYFVGGREKKQKQGDTRTLAACGDDKTKVCFLFGWRREDREQLWRLWLGCSLVQPLFVCFVHRIHDEG